MIKNLGKLWPSQTYSVFWPFESQQRKRLYMDLSASWPLLTSFSGVASSALGDATLPVGECSCLPHIRVARSA